MNNNQKIEYEVVPHRKLKHVHILVTDITRCGVHLHNEIEVFAVIKGKGSVYRNGESVELSPGSIMLFNSNEPHGIEGGDGSVIAVVIQISGHFMQDYFPQLHNVIFEQGNVCVNMEGEARRRMWSSVISAAMNYITANDRFELRCVSHVCSVLEQLMSQLPFSVISENDYLARRKISQRMSRLVSYIDANYQYPIRLAEVAETEGITATHLSHFFTDNFGMSFQQYLNNIRFEHAMRLMDNATMSIADIAAASGFSDTKYMTRICVDRYGFKPRELRQRRAVEDGSVRNARSTQQERNCSDEQSVELMQEFIGEFGIVLSQF